MPQTSDYTTTFLARLLKPIGLCLTAEVAQALVNLRADPSVQNRLDELADKSTEGTLTEDEQAEYEAYVHALDFIAVLQSQARNVLSYRPVS